MYLELQLLCLQAHLSFRDAAFAAGYEKYEKEMKVGQINQQSGTVSN
jgi:hypothetical protein